VLLKAGTLKDLQNRDTDTHTHTRQIIHTVKLAGVLVFVLEN
jgi:hypothetical protein